MMACTRQIHFPINYYTNYIYVYIHIFFGSNETMYFYFTMYTTKFRPTRQGALTVIPKIKIDNFPIALEEEKEKTQLS